MNDRLSIGRHPVSQNVPVFNCIVYLQPNSSGQVTAECANLPDLACVAATEREALARIVSQFKLSIRDHLEKNATIPWIDPPKPKEPSAQTRLIPVHL